VQDGVELHLSKSVLEVKTDCSGVSQIVELLLLAILALSLFRTKRWQKLWIAITAVVIGFLANSARIAALAVFADTGRMDRFRAWHEGTVSPLWTVGATAIALCLWLPVLMARPTTSWRGCRPNCGE
jgi:exosortase/archaeosortase family protein